jgi:hypothetical protein
MRDLQGGISSWSPSSQLKVDEDVIERICRACDVDPLDTRICLVDDDPSLNFQRLSDHQIKNLFKSLAERSDGRSTTKIKDFIEGWKDGVEKNQLDAFKYESLAKQALDSDASVRFKNGRSYSASEREMDVYKDLYRISQSFIYKNYNKNKKIYRGIRNLSVAKIFAQALDRPDASRFVIETSVISNFTGTKEVSNDYSSGIVIESPIMTCCTIMMVDHVFPTSTPEDEVHIAGGKLAVPPEKVLHVGYHTDDERKLSTTVEALDKLYDIVKPYLDDILAIFEIMGKREIGVRTQEGREKVDNWLKLYQTHVSDDKIEKIMPLINYIKKVDDHKEWID